MYVHSPITHCRAPKGGELLTNDAGEITRYFSIAPFGLLRTDSSRRMSSMANCQNSRLGECASIAFLMCRPMAQAFMSSKADKGWGEAGEGGTAEGEEAKETGSSIHAFSLSTPWPLLKLSGTMEKFDLFSRRTVKVNRQYSEECRKLLVLMGILAVIVC
ncbi:hypothetical protein BC826DRAFT_513314 [Russula brevipes]|nr:hypothetical protein BC826DRAFT_513314 [Russula brevipes]